MECHRLHLLSASTSLDNYCIFFRLYHYRIFLLINIYFILIIISLSFIRSFIMFPIHTQHIENTENDMIYHDHDSLEFIYCLHGEVSYLINGESITIHKGEAFMINTHIIHARLSSTAHLMTVSIEREAFSMHESLLSYFDSFFNHEHAPYIVIHDHTIHALITKLYGLLNIPEMNPFLILSSASELVHLASTILPESKPLDDYDKMLEMIHYLRDHLSQKITIQDMADAVSICRSRCCSIFSQYLHTSPMVYLNELRLVHSTELLSKDYSIVSISKMCGFSRPSYFNTQ